MATTAKTARKQGRTRARATRAVATAQASQENKPIWEIAAELSAQIPDEEWAKVPSDLSINLDHYLYDSAREN